MRVTVSFFARLRDLAGCNTWDCDVESGATVGDVWRAVEARFPAVSVLTGRLSCAINTDFSRMDAAVRDGDDVAFLPPVSGG